MAAIRFGIRGFGGEIGATMTDVLMRMKRPAFDRFRAATGESITAFVRGADPRKDRSFQKLAGGGSLLDNTASSYAYARPISDLTFVTGMPGRLRITGEDGRVLDVDYVDLPQRNIDCPDLEARQIDLLVDATGVGVKDEKIEGYNFGNYALLCGGHMVSVASAPVKKVTKEKVPHQLNGLDLAEPGILNATGSCSTHAGVDLIRYMREGVMRKLGLEAGQFVIEGGLFDAHHSLTPSDKPETLQWYRGGYVPQTTGFGDAAAVVYPVPSIGNIKAATGRYYSYQEIQPGVWVNGISQFSLSLTVSLPKGRVAAPELRDLINLALLEAARDPKGRKHIAVVNPEAFAFKDNKKTGLFSLTALTGMTPTTMLPLGDNIDVVKMSGVQVVDGTEREVFVLTVKNAAYDNRLGFTVDFMEELNRISQATLGQEVFPGFDHQVDLGDGLAFINSPLGKQLFAAAIKKANGEILLGHKIA